MARPAKFHREAILAAARDLAADDGPARLTLARLSRQLGAPVGSIYHRYASREALLADLWLETVESFQSDFLARLTDGETITGAVEAVRFACAWVRENPRDARLLLIYRREDFIDGPWPEPLRRRAEQLAHQAERQLRDYCKRLYGRATAAGLARIRLALSDLPQAAARPYLESNQHLPRWTEEMVVDATVYLLRRGNRE